MNNDLIGACGLYCGACDNYRAFRPDGEHLLQTDKFRVPNPETLSCDGCHSGKLTDHCSACKMRHCAKNRGIVHCGICTDYPCENILKFKEDGERWAGATHRTFIFDNIGLMQTIGTEKWKEIQLRRWQCECGQPYTFYETTCHVCGKKAALYVSPKN